MDDALVIEQSVDIISKSTNYQLLNGQAIPIKDALLIEYTALSFDNDAWYLNCGGQACDIVDIQTEGLENNYLGYGLGKTVFDLFGTSRVYTPCAIKEYYNRWLNTAPILASPKRPKATTSKLRLLELNANGTLYSTTNGPLYLKQSDIPLLFDITYLPKLKLDKYLEKLSNLYIGYSGIKTDTFFTVEEVKNNKSPVFYIPLKEWLLTSNKKAYKKPIDVYATVDVNARQWVSYNL